MTSRATRTLMSARRQVEESAMGAEMKVLDSGVDALRVIDPIQAAFLRRFHAGKTTAFNFAAGGPMIRVVGPARQTIYVLLTFFGAAAGAVQVLITSQDSPIPPAGGLSQGPVSDALDVAANRIVQTDAVLRVNEELWVGIFTGVVGGRVGVTEVPLET